MRRTPSQLLEQQAQTTAAMQQAAGALDFETAARLRDELTALDAELTRRGLLRDHTDPYSP